MVLFFIIFFNIWSQADWSGGDKQFYFLDTTKFLQTDNIDIYRPKGFLSLKFISSFPLWDLRENSSDSISRINNIEEVGNDTIFILKSFPGKVYISINGSQPEIFSPLSPFQVSSYNDFFRNLNYWYFSGKTDNSYLLLVSSNKGQSFFLKNISPSPRECNKIFYYKGFINITTDGAYNLYYSPNPDFSSVSYMYVTWNSNLKDLVFSYFNNKADTVAIGILKAGGENIYYTDSPYISSSWRKFYNTFKNIIIGHPIFDSLSGFLYVPVSNTQIAYILVFDYSGNTLIKIDSIQLDNSVLFNSIIAGKDNNIYALTSKGVYRTTDRVKWDTLFYISKGYSIYQNKDYELLIGTYNGAIVYKTSYPSQGFLESSIFISRNENAGATIFRRVFVEGDSLNYVKIQIRGDTLDSLQTAPSWGFIPFQSNGDTITHLNPKFRYFQYRILIYKTPSGKTPRVDKIYFTYDIDTTGPIISECFISDGNVSQNGIDPDDRLVVVFNEKTNRPQIDITGIDTLFYISNGNTLAGSDSVRWISNDTLEIFVFNSFSPPQPGDTLKIIKRFIEDLWGNSNLSSGIIGGSYDDLNPPRLKRVILTDGITPDDGANTGDTVKLIFSEKTNIPSVPPESLDSWFPLDRGSWLNSGYTIQTAWKSEDTLLILFNGSGEEPILRDDSINVSSNNPIEDLGGNPIIPGKIKTVGTLDSKNPFIEFAIFYDYSPFSPNPNSIFDHTIIKFSEPVILMDSVDKSNIDSVFKLSYNHSWLSGNGEITRIELLNDTIFLIQFSTDGGNPTVTEGDSIYTDSLFFVDRNKNKIKGISILQRMLEIQEKEIRENNFLLKIKNRTILINTPFEIGFEIFDISGRKVFNKNFKKGIYKEVLNLKSGIYFIKLERGKKKFIKKKIFLIR